MSRWGAIWTVATKEVVETLRDRKTIILMVVVPLVLYPLMFVGLSQMTLVQQARIDATHVRVGVQGEPPTELTVALEAMDRAEVSAVIDAREAVAGSYLDAAIIIVPAADAASASRVEIVFDGAVSASREASDRALAVVETWSDALRDARIAALGVEPEYLEPVDVISANVAPPQRQGGWLLGQILPMLVSVLMIGATFHPAIDLTAGEKERGTLQTLLTAPISTSAIITGKFVAVVVLALGAALMNLASVALVAVNIPLPPEIAGSLSFGLGFGAAFLVFAMLVALGMMFGALMMAVAVTANSFKEAQNYLTPLYLVCIFPLMLTSLPGVELDGATAVIPILNLALAMKALLVGPVSGQLIFVVLASTLIWTGLALALAVRVFKMEAVQLGDSGVSALFRRRPAGQRELAVATPGEALTLLGIILLLMFYGSAAMGSVHALASVHFTQYGALLLPAIALTIGLRLSPRQTFALRRPPAVYLLAAVLLGAGLWYAATLLMQVVTERWLPVPDELFGRAMADLLAAAETPAGTALLYSGIAIAPAICEEAVFRGVVLQSLLTRVSPRAAVFASAALFSVYHLNVYQAPTTFLIGLLMGALVLKSRSILPAVVLHAMHNGITLGFQLHGSGEATLASPLAWLLLAPIAGGLILVMAPHAEPSRGTASTR